MMRQTRAVSTLALAALFPFAASSVEAADTTASEPEVFVCGADGAKCSQRIIRIPDGQPGQVLKFEYCQEGDCDRAHREHWRTYYLVPPAGDVCRNANITEALRWIEQNAQGWLLAGWGCVSKPKLSI